MPEARPKTVSRPVSPSFSFGRPEHRHHLKIAKVSIPADAAHVNETEAFNGIVFPGIARAIVAARNGIRTQLHQPKGSPLRLEILALPILHTGADADHWIDAVHQWRCRAACRNENAPKKCRAKTEVKPSHDLIWNRLIRRNARDNPPFGISRFKAQPTDRTWIFHRHELELKIGNSRIHQKYLSARDATYPRRHSS